MPVAEKLKWHESEVGTPAYGVFIAMRTCLDIMKNDGNAFIKQASNFIMDVALQQNLMTDIQLVGLESAAGQMTFSPAFDYELTKILNELTYAPWDKLGVKRMPQSAALLPDQRSGLIQLVYAFCVDKIEAESVRLQQIAAMPFELPDWQLTIPEPSEEPPPEEPSEEPGE